MSISYEFDAPQYIDFSNLENVQNVSEYFFMYLCMSIFGSVKVKKKKLKLDNEEEESSKAQVSTPVSKCYRRSFVGLRKYRSTPYPRGRSLKRLSTSKDLPRFRGLNTKCLRKLKPKVKNLTSA